MSVRALQTMGRIGLLLWAGAFVAGCGNDNRVSASREFLTNITSQIGNRRDSTPSQVTAAQVAQAQASLDVPILLVEIENLKSTGLFPQIAQNGNVVTFATGARQSLALENGMLRGTRALGDDLMSAELGPLRDAIGSGTDTGGQRTLRFLNAASERYELSVNCRYDTGPVVTETCTQPGGAPAFTNTYEVNRDGIVVSSRQWVSPTIGYIKIQRIQ